MISYQNFEATGFHSEGFETSLPSPMSVKIEEGKLFIEDKVFEYPAIEFDVEADDELETQYDVYLLSKPGSDGLMVHIDRSELAIDSVAFYEGDGTLQHLLLSFTIPPNATSVGDLLIRTVVQTPEEVDSDENPTE